MGPPSRHLLKTLSDLQICTAADLRACRGRVRQLSRDLPAFDSVWIDALLQARRITPYQAQVLQSADPSQLRIGPCLVLDRLGQTRMAATYLARRLPGSEKCVLKRIPLAADVLTERRQRLDTAIRNLSGWQHPAIVAPSVGLVHDGQLVALSTPVLGPHLRELLVRRGRFPPSVVIGLAAQLLDGLAELESRGEVHGDIRLNNVRITAAGQAVLVDAAIAPAVHPELTIHASLPPHRYDGVAPELIGGGRRATSRSDIYALGCLMWELLAGRPPFATGDSLGKLVSHQTRKVPDVRDRAPETPASLADAIRSLTAHDPAERPRSLREVRDRWKSPGPATRRRLARFASRFHSAAAPPTSERALGGYWTTAVAAVFLLSGLSLTLLDRTARSSILAFGNRAAGWVTPAANDRDSGLHAERPVDPTSDKPEALKPLPLPDASGVIALPDAGPWEAAEITLAGPVTVRGTANRPAVIVIDGRPLALTAERVRLEYVRLRFGESVPRHSRGESLGISDSSVLLMANCRDLILRSCEFEAAGVAADPAESAATATRRSATAVRWSPLQPSDARGGRLFVQDTVFLGGSALVTSRPPREVQVRNVLSIGGDPFLTFEKAIATGRTCRLDAARLTFRQSRGLLDMPSPTEGAGKIVVEAVDCVFDLATVNSALVLLRSEPGSPQWSESLEFGGEGNLVSPDLTLAACTSLVGDWQPLDASALEVDGLLAGRHEFAGPLSTKAGDSALRSCDSPRRSAALPGIDAAHLPTR